MTRIKFQKYYPSFIGLFLFLNKRHELKGMMMPHIIIDVLADVSYFYIYLELLLLLALNNLSLRTAPFTFK